MLEFRPKLLAADIDLPSTRPILPPARAHGSGIAGTAGCRYDPATQIVLNSLVIRLFSEAWHTARCEGLRPDLG